MSHGDRKEAEANKDSNGESHKLATGTDRRLSFTLGDQRFAIPLLSVKEVIAVPGLTPVPFTPAHFLGIMNLRGQVISVIDLKKKLEIRGQSKAEANERAVIICDIRPLTLGIVVDSVDAVLSPDRNQIMPKPEGTGAKHSAFITGIFNHNKELILLLDIAAALDVADIAAIEQSASNKRVA